MCELASKIVIYCLDFYQNYKHLRWVIIYRNDRRVHRFILCQHYMMSRWFCPPSFAAVSCLVRGCWRETVIRHRMTCLVISWRKQLYLCKTVLRISFILLPSHKNKVCAMRKKNDCTGISNRYISLELVGIRSRPKSSKDNDQLKIPKKLPCIL